MACFSIAGSIEKFCSIIFKIFFGRFYQLKYHFFFTMKPDVYLPYWKFFDSPADFPLTHSLNMIFFKIFNKNSHLCSNFNDELSSLLINGNLDFEKIFCLMFSLSCHFGHQNAKKYQKSTYLAVFSNIDCLTF